MPGDRAATALGEHPHPTPAVQHSTTQKETELVTETQAWILLVEGGFIALWALVALVRR